MADLQEQVTQLTDVVTEQQQAIAKATAHLKRMSDFLAARSDLTNVLVEVLLAHADPIAKNAAIAAAQVRGEQLNEKGPPEIARNYAELLAGIAPS
jgi:uncharacterized coiled-coil protein SlyX